MKIKLAAFSCLCATLIVSQTTQAEPYRWHHARTSSSTLIKTIAPPVSFKRVSADQGSFAHWLRRLPMKPRGAKVMLYNGEPKWRQDVHIAVVDIDVGRRDLQQCADAVMRLRAEYLLARGREADIAFNDTGSAKPMSYVRWAKGERPRISGRHMRWSRRARPDNSYRNFRKYMTIVFAYAGTYSLSKQLRSVSLSRIKIGDVFIKGGFPGHAVLVADMVVNPATGEKRFLLLQSFMPAQDIHVLKNPSAADGSPWYPASFTGPLVTPEWTFPPHSLKRWR